MGIVNGGKVIGPSTAGSPGNPGLKNRIYKVEGVPTDANIGLEAGQITNGMLAEDVTTTFVYERRAGVWTRTDTL